MITLKSNFKRIILGIASAVTILAFSVTPALAAEETTSPSDDVSSTQELISPIPAEPQEFMDWVDSIDPSTVPETPEEVTPKDLSTDELITRAGTETWYGSGLAGNYTFRDYNLTPVKIMGKSGTLLIHGSFYGDDGYADVSPIKLTVEIRSTSGAVKGRTVVVDDRSGATSFSVSASVYAGEQIQLFFDASSVANPPGILRSAHPTYYYDLY